MPMYVSTTPTLRYGTVDSRHAVQNVVRAAESCLPCASVDPQTSFRTQGQAVDVQFLPDTWVPGNIVSVAFDEVSAPRL